MDSTLVVETNWADVAKQVVDAGTGAIAEMSSMIKGMAPEVWSILLKQVYIQAWSWLIVPALACLVCWLAFRPMYKRAIETDWDNPGSSIGTFVSGFGMLVFALVWVFHLDVVISGLFNPEYYAIQKFFAIASGGGL